MTRTDEGAIYWFWAMCVLAGICYYLYGDCKEATLFMILGVMAL